MQVIAEHGADFSLASLKAMTYLEAVMRETQRRYPIVGGVFRKALRSFELPGRYHIPKVLAPCSNSSCVVLLPLKTCIPEHAVPGSLCDLSLHCSSSLGHPEKPSHVRLWVYCMHAHIGAYT